jgi:hypothetical protein
MRSILGVAPVSKSLKEVEYQSVMLAFPRITQIAATG